LPVQRVAELLNLLRVGDERLDVGWKIPAV
jgi:hypothetical protein